MTVAFTTVQGGGPVERYRAPALDKGLDIIELLATAEEGLTLGAIAKALGRTSNEIYRMLDTLVRRTYVARDGDNYRLTLKIFALAHQHPPMRRLVSDVTPSVREFSLWSEQSCHLAVYDRGGVLIVAQFESPSYFGLAIRIGARIGLTNTGSGRVLLAFAAPDERDRMLAEYEPAVGETVPPNLARLLERIRARGHERMRSQQIRGVVNLSVPIVGPDGSALAALSVPFLERIDRPDAPELDVVLARMLEFAGRISAAIGGVPVARLQLPSRPYV
jgi:DNA-binding IclR family transcriptional regulator